MQLAGNGHLDSIGVGLGLQTDSFFTRKLMQGDADSRPSLDSDDLVGYTPNDGQISDEPGTEEDATANPSPVPGTSVTLSPPPPSDVAAPPGQLPGGPDAYLDAGRSTVILTPPPVPIGDPAFSFPPPPQKQQIVYLKSPPPPPPAIPAAPWAPYRDDSWNWTTSTPGLFQNLTGTTVEQISAAAGMPVPAPTAAS